MYLIIKIMDKKSAPKIMKPVDCSLVNESQFDIKKMALKDKKKARIHRKEIFETASKKNADPKKRRENKNKRKKLYKEKGIKTTLYN